VILRAFLASALLAAAAPAAAQAAAPAAPAGLAVRASGKHAAVLSWDAAPGALRYRVLRAGRKLRDLDARTVKLSLGKAKVRYQVVAIGKRGKLGKRSAAVTLLRLHSSPRAPVGAAATDVTGSAATLTWGKSKAARATVASYRVLAGPLTVKSVKATTVRLTGLSTSRTLTYRIIAIDSLGWASKPSGPITVVTGHSAPSAPGAPQAITVSDTTLTLSWPAATLPAESTLRGYRLLRDGVVVTQVTGTSAGLTNLTPKSTHGWSVMALDTRGYASPPSPVTSILQADPPPSTGDAQTFLLASTDTSFVAFQEHYRQIGVVYPTFFDCNLQTGAITGKNDALIVSYAQNRKIKVLPRFNCQNTVLLHKILTDPTLRAAWLDTMVGDVAQYGYDGAQVDLEAVAATDRDALTAFVAELSGRLHAQGKLLSQAVSGKVKDIPNHPRSTAFDYIALSRYDDYVFVMAWGIHWATSAPGAQDDAGWVTQVADYVATMPNKQKFVMGTMLYGFDWAAGGGAAHPAVPLDFAGIQALIVQYGVQPVYDPTADSMHLAYTDAGGVPHDVWYSDGAIVGRRVALARARGLGVGFWRIGQEDETIWNDVQLPGAPS
jgi:spore germination protein YaaH